MEDEIDETALDEAALHETALGETAFGDPLDEGAPPEAETIGRILRAVSGEVGVDFSLYRPALLGRRIARRIERVGAGSHEVYLELVERSRPERQALFEELLIDVSGFFRDPEVFDLLAERVLPDLVDRAVTAGTGLRIWSAACATGEEAYSIAMLVTEVAERFGAPDLDVRIFAGDVNTIALNKASSGLYGVEEVEGVAPDRLERFFSPTSVGFRIEPALRSRITFTRHDLLADPGFVRLDLVLCRNVLIYLEPAAQQRVVGSLASGLRDGGVLVLGTAEELGPLSADFTAVEQELRVFRKAGSEATQAQVRSVAQERRAVTPPSSVAPVAPDQRLLRAYDAILDVHLGPALLIGEHRELVHTFGDATAWLRQPGGRSTLDVVELVADPALRIAISSLLRDLREQPGQLAVRPVVVPGSDGPVSADLTGQRLDVGGAVFDLVHAERPTILRAPERAAREIVDPDGAADVAFLRDSLQTAIDDLERSNSDLAATNEAVVAANEELQSANEELSSVNEELRSLNDEHHRRLQEVLEVSSDLEFLLSDIELGVVFLDHDLVVRRVSAAARRHFRIHPEVEGRTIGELITYLDVPDLVEIVERVWESGQPHRARVAHLADPSLTVGLGVSRSEAAGAPVGVVLTVGDLSAVVSMETNQMRFIRMLNRGPVALFAKDGAGRFWFKNRLAEAFVGSGLGGTTHDVYSGDLASRLIADDALVARTGRAVQRVVRLPLGGESVETLVVKFPLEGGGVGGVGLELHHGEQLAASSELRNLDATVDALSLAVIEQIGDVLVDRGGRFQHLTGYPPDGWLSRVNADDRAFVERALGSPDAEPVFRLLETDGHWRWVELRIVEGAGASHRFLVFVDRHADVTTVESLRGQLRDARRRTLPQQGMVDAERNEILLERVDRAISGISRQFRRRVATVDAFADMLEQDPGTSDGGRQNLARLRSANDWLVGAVESLDRLVAIGHRPLGPGPADLAALSVRAVDQRSERIAEGGVTVGLGDLPSVDADPEAVSVVLGELLDNALTHGAGPTSSRIEISAVVDGDAVVLTVADDGPGFDPDHAVRIFQPFHRAADEADSDGVGIGLTLARRLVRRLGGEIWARSEPGGGASFHVQLPAAGAGSVEVGSQD